MPLPTTNVRVRPELQETMQQFPIAMAMANSIALDVCPPVDVEDQAGIHGFIPINEILTPTGGKRNSRGGYLRNEMQFSTKSWETEENGGEGVVDERDSHKFANYFDHELVVAQREQFAAIQRREMRVAALLTDASNYSGQTTAMGTTIDNYSSATPVTKIEAAMQAVYDRTGIWPNTMWMSIKSFRDLRLCDEVIERIESAGAGQSSKASEVSVKTLEQVFDIEKIAVGRMPKNTAVINQTASIAPVWSDSVIGVAYIDRSGSREMPTHARCYHWSKDGSQIGGLIEDYIDDATRQHIIRVRQDTDEQQVIAELGQLLTGVHS